MAERRKTGLRCMGRVYRSCWGAGCGGLGARGTLTVRFRLGASWFGAPGPQGVKNSTGTQSSMSPGSLTTCRIARCAMLSALGVLLASGLGRAQIVASGVPLIYPTAIAFDQNGVLYIAETGRHRIDRLDASGTLTVVAGEGTQGYGGDGGPATAAQLDSPQGIAVDASGNLYVADTHNHRVRMVTAATGKISTVAGTGVPGFGGDGSGGVTARLSLPTALALDGAGNLYVADAGNQRIRKVVLATGTMSTVAGNGTQGNSGDMGPALSASLDTPSGLAANAAGDLYLADLHNRRVRRVAHDTGVITTLAAALRLPRGLSVDSGGNIFVAEAGDQRIVRIAADGTVTSLVGTGTEGYGGDGGPATMALLDGPRATGVSAGGLLTLADTGNRRIRQVDAAGIIGPAGAAGAALSTLSLTAPGPVQYGGGAVTATLAATSLATGTVSFLEVTAGMPTLLGTGTLAMNAASFSTAGLPAGMHRLTATYAGDAGHSAAGSAVFLLTVTPAPLQALPVAASVLYGAGLPTLTGSLSGVLARDANLVSAVFGTAATELSPVGSYAIGATLTGVAAANYQVAVVPANLTILQAPTTTTASTTANSVTVGTAVTLSAKAVSTTKGIPSGRVTFLDGGAVLGQAVADGSGAAMLPATLGVGTHTISAVYGGDGNFLPSTSGGFGEVVLAGPGSGPDFSVAVAGASSQTAPAGATASFGFNVSILNGPLNGPIQLTASGMPPGATATFSPAYLPPGGAVPAFTLSVQTVKGAAVSSVPALGILVGSLALLPWRRRRKGAWLLGALLVSSVALEGCGAFITPVPNAAAGASRSYAMTVVATSTLPGGTTLQHSAVVTLIVQ